MTESITQYNYDGAMTDALSAIGNGATGLGTLRDKSQYMAVNGQTYKLSKWELENLFQNDRLIEKAIAAYPRDAARNWGEWSLDSGDPQAIPQYAKGLRLRKAFTEAGIDGRLYGDAFIVLGIDDGQPAEEPVDEARIQSVRSVTSGCKL